MSQPDPSHIMQVGTGFWASKTLLSAVELGVFTVLGSGSKTLNELEDELGLHTNGSRDFLDALVALKFLDRDGEAYSNNQNSAVFLDKSSPAYLGGILEMLNGRLYGYWGDLTEALQTGQPQNEIKHTGKPMFEGIYDDPNHLEIFMDGMTGFSLGTFMAFADKFDFSNAKTMLDAGGATGLLSVTCARKHPHLSCISLDMPQVEPIAKRHIEKAGLSDRVQAVTGDFFGGPFPKADLVVMSLILHDWNLEKKKLLIKSAYDALPEGGQFVVIENLIDDERKENAFGLLMSLNMLIETGDGFDYSGADFDGWCREAGFKGTKVIHVAGPSFAAIATK